MGSTDGLYSSKVVTAEEAIAHLPEAGNLWLHHAIMEPKTLVRALVAARERFEGLRVFHMVRNGPVDITEPGYEKYFIDNPLFAGANSRAALADGRADFTPAFFFEVPGLIRTGRIPCDAVLVQVSPPDEAGNCSMGASVDYTMQAVKTARLVIAQVNSHVPRTVGDCFLNISEFDYIVEADEDIWDITPPVIGDVEKAIGANCASLIEDGATLQLGIGGIPDAVMLFLENKKDLGIHSEMISDGTLALFEKGVINNSRKSENRGKMTLMFLMGTQRLYRAADGNPDIEMFPADYVNHPMTIMRQYKPVAVNSAIEVDLQGQVVATAMGLRQFSGTGGQVDFVRGCAMAEGGKAIIAMPSSTVKKDGTRLSKIVSFIAPGAPVTTGRDDVDYVVTEQGIAELKGKSLRQRAKALIEIAHPDFRADLRAEFNKRFI
ncbi:MAG: 4-hydroxybutyrate CoA-transferase [Clostridiales Family XIII bacterium]|jgi:4-hydroxybutyrate CoA-transferase|nr:4-hydroxybutyrate CoA-transferase [Clostridiales Family XIII bacterium]